MPALQERANGAHTSDTRTAVRVARVELDGNYVGWTATMRLNPPLRVIEDLRSGDMGRFRSALATVVLDWDFVDDDGAPLPLPRDGLNWEELPWDLEATLIRCYGVAFNVSVEVPKATPTPSEPTSQRDT